MIEIKIPFKTPSINHLHGHNRFGAFYLKPEAKKLKEEIKEIIINSNFQSCSLEETRLKVIVEIHENWFTLKGKVARKDISNREKFLIDSIFDALGLEDKFIFEHTLVKVQDEKEFSIIKITGL